MGWLLLWAVVLVLSCAAGVMFGNWLADVVGYRRHRETTRTYTNDYHDAPTHTEG